MNRRLLIGLGLGVAALLLASGHTPYRQWVVYRKRRLLIGTSKTDGPTYPLGLRVAEVLLAHLPESKARASSTSATCLLYTSPSPRDGLLSRMPSSA